MAAEVGAALGVPLTGAALGGSVGSASRAVDGAAGVAAGRSDRERATVYLEALFTGAGVPAERHGRGGADCLGDSTRSGISGAAPAGDTEEALDRLRAAGLRLGVVSNSDGRVEEALRAAGLDDRLRRDRRLDAGRGGEARSRYLPCRAGGSGVGPEEALYVGDLYDVDVVGARAAGIEAVLLVAAAAEPGPECRRRRFRSSPWRDDLLTGGRT